jgi:type I restriction-modification system DNA methylase subunit
MDYSTLSHDELIDKCKELNLDYLTKAKKPKAIKTLITLLKKGVNESTSTSTSYNDNYSSLEVIIDKCHNFLYTKGVTGSKAQNDIMKFFTLVIINHLNNNNNEYIKHLIDNYKKTNTVLIMFYDKYDGNLENVEENRKSTFQDYLYYLEYLTDISQITKADRRNVKCDEKDMWKKFILECLCKIFPDIYSNEDYILNCKYTYAISNLIDIISKFKINDLVIGEIQSFNGDIHEKFLKYQGNKNSKELGQFFTPRGIIKSILNDCGFKELIEKLDGDNNDIYDPCLGTGGLLCYTYDACKSKIKPENIYGCEIEPDTLKLGIVSLMISTNSCNKNIKRCNSLIENPYLFEEKKFDIIFTNPPFGTKTNYKQLETDFETYKKTNYPDSPLKFKDIYTIQANNGINLFIQNIIYLLKTGGIACIILPDGELMVGKNNINIRKFILNNCRILKIITINGGAFTNTNIKTKALIIQKGDYDNYNHEVEYIDIHSTGITNLGFNKLNENLSFNNEIIEEEHKYRDDIEIIKFGDMFDLIKGSIQSSKVVEDPDGNIIFISKAEITEETRKIKYEYYNTNALYIAQAFNGNGKCPIRYYKNNSIHSNLLYHINIKENYIDKINIKYIYYYLKNKQEYIEDNYQKGCANKSLDVDRFNLMKIPLLPLEKQNELVELLDGIYEIIEDNKNKINKIKTINDLYLKNKLYLNKFEIKTLGEVSIIHNGKLLIKNDMIDGIYNVIGGGKIIGTHNIKNRDGDDVIITRVGDINVNYINNAYYLTDNAFALKSLNDNIMITKYLYYNILSNKEYLKDLYNGAAQKVISKTNLNNVKIPIPSIEVQNEIIEYLDYNSDIIKSLEKENELNKSVAENLFKQIL